MRKPAARVKPRLARDASFPAPVDGWIASLNLATPNARRPDGRKVAGAAPLRNGVPTATGVRMRGGSVLHASLGDMTTDVQSIFSYISGSTRRLFGADGAGIYDITTPANPAISPTAEVDSLSSGDWSVVQFSTAGGTFLRLVNGVDVPLVYDGSSWDTSPAITGATPEDLCYVWAYKQRLFFIEKNSLNAWYLSVDQIGGAATKLPLGGVFSRGGSLLFGASWSLDTGGGLSEQCVFVTTEGEVAVYQGANPGDASDWQKVGVYKIGRPRGPKAFIRAGGDLVIATDIGFVPLSQAIQKDLAALSPSAVSYSIETEWNDAVADRSSAYWSCDIWPAKQMALVALHNSVTQEAQMFVANVRTGAWGVYTGWEGKCLHVFGDRCFFGSKNGKIIEAEVSGADQGMPYTFVMVPLFDPLKTPASLKTGLQARVVFKAPRAIEAKLSLQVDYAINLPSAPDDAAVIGEDVWGVGVWGEAKWGSPPEKKTFAEWRSVSGSGYALSVACQITSGAVPAPDVEIVQIDLTYDLGEPQS